MADQETQCASHTYAIGANGSILSDKGEDRIIDADRCAALAHYLDTHLAPESAPLRARVEFF